MPEGGEGDARESVGRERGDGDGREEDECRGDGAVCARVVMSSGQHLLFRPSKKGHRRERLQLDRGRF
jgi:hypothetical protein